MTESFRKGPLTMLFSSLCFAVMAFFAKLTGGRVPGAEVSFFRFAVGIGAALVLAATGRISLRAGRKDLLIARGVFGGGSILLLFLALSRGSLTNISVLNNTYPIFATLAAALFLSEGIGWAAGASMTVTWVGVWLLVHPDFQHLRWPEMMSLASAILAGAAVVAVRELRRRGEPSWTVYFYLSLFGLGFSFLAALPFWVWPDRREGLFLLLMALFGLIGQIAMTSAYKYCRTSTGGVLSMTMSVFAALLGLVVLHETMTAGEAAGAFLILAGSVLVLLLTGKEGQAEAKTPVALPPML